MTSLLQLQPQETSNTNTKRRSIFETLDLCLLRHTAIHGTIYIPYGVRDIIKSYVHKIIVITSDNIREIVEQHCDEKYVQQCCLTFGPISDWDVSRVTNMERLFMNKEMFNDDISSWDVSNVTNMTQMFSGAVSFNCNISSWNTSHVLSMRSMFSRALVFDQNIGGWDVGSVSNMVSMFQGAATFNQPLDTWDTSRVFNMSYMFHHATSFNQSLKSWARDKLCVASLPAVRPVLINQSTEDGT